MLAFVVQDCSLVAKKEPLPKLLPGWALVSVRLAGICNTDVEILRGYHGFRGTPGHEFVGEVADVHGVSAAAKKKWLRRRVCGEINVSCSAHGFKPICDFCRRGMKTHCARRTVLGIVNHDGAFAEYLALPLENLHLVPKNVTDEQAVFVEPLAAACEILDQVNVKNFRSAAVLGDGKLAQLIARVLRTAMPRVVMYGRHEKKLALARRAEIQTKKVRGNASDLNRIRETFRLVVEATGSPSGLALAQHMTEPRGTLVLKSTFHGGAPVETWPIVVKEITVVGSRCGPFSKAIALLRSGKLDRTPLITRTFPLTQARAVAYARGDGDDRNGNESADDAGKRAFHSSHTDDHASLSQLALAVFEQAMNACYADVVERFCAVAHHTRREQRLLRDGDVAGARGDDENGSLARDFMAALDGDGARQLVKLRDTRVFSRFAFHGCKNLFVGAGHQDVVPRVFLSQHGAHNFRNLLRGLAFSENHFGKTLTQSAVMIHLCKAEIFKWQMLQALDGFVRRELAGFHGFQYFQQFTLIHNLRPPRILSPQRTIALA